MKRAADRLWTPQMYGRIARLYDRLSRWLFPLAEQARGHVVADLKAGRILDVGCGTGTLLGMAATRGLTCDGLDTSPSMLSIASAKVPGGTFTLASYYAMPYPDGSFDYVVETNALGGVGIDINQALREMVRVCKPGGEIRLVDYAPPPHPTWKSRLTVKLSVLLGDEPRDFSAVIRSLGFEPEVSVLGWFGLYQFIRVKKAG